MRFRFDPNQEHQVTAVDAVAQLFDGQPRVEMDLSLTLGAGLGAVANRLDLDDEAILANLRGVQEDNGLPVDETLLYVEGTAETPDGSKDVRFPNFSVEMETGTGKTYAYVRTALELFRQYGQRKFKVVVPSVAIREGVLKDLRITQQHFREMFENTPYRFYAYDSGNVHQVRQFALSDSVEFMVMTIDSFNKATNIMRQSTDRLLGETPIHLVQGTRPVLILDEPQNMESELSKAALADLDPLFALRYSATHRNPYNLVYRLTPFDAYRQGLVKRIAVASVLKEGDFNTPFMRLDRIDARRQSISARVAVHKLMRTGSVREKTVSVRRGDSLADKAGRSEYEGYNVEEIDATAETIAFSNGVALIKGEAFGGNTSAIFREQIRYTVEEHFRRQSALRDDGIKVLSLFFIDRVDNYAPADGIIRKLFSEAFDEFKNEYQDWSELDADAVQAAYFAARRRRSGEVVAINTGGETEADREAYDLIMKDKERLLSFSEPVAFIFSHSALREGWDNPNVFQICTLNQTVSELRKRQEVGRGIRLCRNQEGERVHDERKNILTVVANESYDRYVASLQREIEEEYGAEGVPPTPANARKRRVAKLRRERRLSPEFGELWERIKQKTRYAVEIDTEKLLTDVLVDVNGINVGAPRIAITRAEVEVGEGATTYDYHITGTRTSAPLQAGFGLPNLVGTMQDLFERTSPPTRLTRRTLLEVFNRTSNKAAAMKNPHEFATQAVRIIKDNLIDQLVTGIQYEKVDDSYDMILFDAEVESWEQYLVPTERAIYDHVVFDSEVERKFVEGLERIDSVSVYCKLPAWFVVDTPLGKYNPDWAIVWEPRDAHGRPTGEQRLYLVRETKGEKWQTTLRPNELRKIRCAQAHFEHALAVDFAVVTSPEELLSKNGESRDAQGD
jgi:type III restriction enzyme